MSSEGLSKEETIRLELIKSLLAMKSFEYASANMVQMVANDHVRYILTGK